MLLCSLSDHCMWWTKIKNNAWNQRLSHSITECYCHSELKLHFISTCFYRDQRKQASLLYFWHLLHVCCSVKQHCYHSGLFWLVFLKCDNVFSQRLFFYFILYPSKLICITVDCISEKHEGKFHILKVLSSVHSHNSRTLTPAVVKELIVSSAAV